MWEQYKKTFVPMQILIVVICVAVYFGNHREWVPAMVLLVVMEAAALLGAGWGASIKYRKRRAQERAEGLPLNRRP